MRNRIFVALAVFALAVATQSVWADGVQLNFSGVQSGQSNLLAPLGKTTSDSAEPVDQLDAIVDDVGKGPFSISGGALSFSTPNATSVDVTLLPAYFNYYSAVGGTLTLTGSIFGLPNGSPLLTAKFAIPNPPSYAATTNVFVDPTADVIDFGGLLSISWVSPVLLSNLGADDTFGSQSFGSVSVVRYHNAATGSLDTLTNVTVLLAPEVAAPEPATFVILGAGLFAVSARRRWQP